MDADRRNSAMPPRHEEDSSDSAYASDQSSAPSRQESLSPKGRGERSESVSHDSDISEGISLEPSHVDRPNSAKAKAECEFKKIAEAYPNLRATGCTAQFCQAGRMIKTNEPRIGNDKSVDAVVSDARDFLKQLRADEIFKSDDELERRTEQVITEIETNLSPTWHSRQDGRARKNVMPGSPGWVQTYDELQHGVRLAWKHSQRCIMRSEYRSLQ